MRERAVRGLIVLAAACAVVAGVARARETPLEVRLAPPERIAVGDRARVVVDVRVRPDGGHPVMVTPRSEGAAVEVVRGRLLRADASASDGALRFEVPIVARGAGTSVLRVRVLAYVCERACRAVETEASAVLRVE